MQIEKAYQRNEQILEPLGHPINGAYYMGGVYNPAYLHEPYGQNGYIDPTYGDPNQQHQSQHQYPYYGYPNYSHYNYQQSSAYPGAYGPYPGASGAYRPYPQPAPSPPRRSRTAPSRPRSTAPTMGTLGAESRRGGHQPRGVSAEAFDRRQYKAYSGPAKKPLPMYRKKREPPIVGRYQETDFGGGGGGGIGDSSGFTPYNRNYYGDIGGHRSDGLLTAAGCFFWLVAGFVEAYFAACYPPNGPRINLVCHRPEWIIACVLAFINFLVFVADFVLSWMNGASML
uniref:MARVEL domain-containing protein n=1 Tax=Caenorhabditis tropicalis TaxID=1561998 RepID=A0A1I7UAY9_9PELO